MIKFILVSLTLIILNETFVISTPDSSIVAQQCSETKTGVDSHSLLTMLSVLSGNAKQPGNNGYYATSVAVLGGRGEIVYGEYLCRGDLPPQECGDCISDATRKLPPVNCPTARTVITWYEKCLIQYSDSSFLGTVDESIHIAFKNKENVATDPQTFLAKVGLSFHKLAQGMLANTTGTGARKYFGTENDNLLDSFASLYTLAQCTPDLAPGDCVKCLQIIMNEIPNVCLIRKGCRILNPSCHLRYEQYSFAQLPVPTSSPLASLNGKQEQGRKKGMGGRSIVLKILLPILLLLLLISIGLYMKRPKTSQVDRAILALKTQRRELGDYQRQLDAAIKAEIQAARDMIREKKKDRALQALRKKKVQEELLQKVDSWLINVEQQLANIELASKKKAVFDSLKAGSDALKSIQSELSLDDVHKVMDDTVEAKAYQEEVNAILGEELSAEDDEAVLAEFESLEAELMVEELPDSVAVPEVGDHYTRKN